MEQLALGTTVWLAKTRGTIRYVGSLPSLRGTWLGLELTASAPPPSTADCIFPRADEPPDSLRPLAAQAVADLAAQLDLPLFVHDTPSATLYSHEAPAGIHVPLDSVDRYELLASGPTPHPSSSASSAPSSPSLSDSLSAYILPSTRARALVAFASRLGLRSSATASKGELHTSNLNNRAVATFSLDPLMLSGAVSPAQLEAQAQIRHRLASPSLLPFQGLAANSAAQWAFLLHGSAPLSLPALALADSLDAILTTLTAAAAALHYLNSLGIVHGALCFEALYASLDRTSVAVLHLAPGLNSVILPAYAYAAPEAFQRKLPLTPAADVFSFGLLVWALWAGEPPFPTSLDRTKAWNERPPLADHWPALVCSLIDECLQLVPSRRASPARILGYLALIRHAAAGSPAALLDAISHADTPSATRLLAWRPDISDPDALYRILPPLSLPAFGSLAAICVAGSRVFLASSSSPAVIALSLAATASRLRSSWQYPLTASPTAMHLLDAGTVLLVALDDGALLALHPSSGELLASRPNPPRSVIDFGTAANARVHAVGMTFSAATSTLVLGYSNGVLVLVTTSDADAATLLTRASRWRALSSPHLPELSSNALLQTCGGFLVVHRRLPFEPLLVFHLDSRILVGLVPEPVAPPAIVTALHLAAIPDLEDTFTLLVASSVGTVTPVHIVCKIEADGHTASVDVLTEDAALVTETPIGLRSLIFVPDAGIVLAGADDGSLVAWDWPTRAIRNHWFGSSPAHVIGPVHALTLTQSGLVFSAGADGTLRVWQPESGTQIYAFPALPAPLTSLYLLGSSHVLAVGHQGLGVAWSTLPLAFLASLGAAERLSPTQAIAVPPMYPDRFPPFDPALLASSQPDVLQQTLTRILVPLLVTDADMAAPTTLPLARSLASIPFAAVRLATTLHAKGFLVAGLDLPPQSDSTQLHPLADIISLASPHIVPLVAVSHVAESPDMGVGLAHLLPHQPRSLAWVWYDHMPDDRPLALSMASGALSTLSARIAALHDLASALKTVHALGAVHGAICPSMVWASPRGDGWIFRLVVPPALISSPETVAAHLTHVHAGLVTATTPEAAAEFSGPETSLELELDLAAALESRVGRDKWATLVEPQAYAPPEGLARTAAADMYAFGLLAHEVLAGLPLVSWRDPENRWLRPRHQTWWPTPLRTLVLSALAVDPQHRISASDALALLEDAAAAAAAGTHALVAAALVDHDAITVDSLAIHLPAQVGDPAPALPTKHLTLVSGIVSLTCGASRVVATLAADGSVMVWHLAPTLGNRLDAESASQLHSLRIGAPRVRNMVALVSLSSLSLPGTTSRASTPVVLASSQGNPELSGRHILLHPRNPLFVIEDAHPHGVAAFHLLALQSDTEAAISFGVSEDSVKVWSLSSLALVRGLWLPDSAGAVVDVCPGPDGVVYALAGDAELVYPIPTPSGALNGRIRSVPLAPWEANVHLVLVWLPRLGRLVGLRVAWSEATLAGPIVDLLFEDWCVNWVVYAQPSPDAFPAAPLLDQAGGAISVAVGVSVLNQLLHDELLAERGGVLDESSLSYAYSPEKAFSETASAAHARHSPWSATPLDTPWHLHPALSPATPMPTPAAVAASQGTDAAPLRGIVHVWDLLGHTPRVRLLIDAHAAALTAIVALTATATVVTASTDGTVRAWDTKTGRLLCTLLDVGDHIVPTVVVQAPTPDDHMLWIGASDGSVRVVDVVDHIGRALV
ncbi:serine/threonine protein kinase [Thecamonas trahens ATCC 50062]|uniref:Serine/threonine protein kinase n=1 Tax=Thecamonas trahens ATCC 50062 TaxID=461836 RepID=A0A0L0DGJ3_THETB|nr:serine/threonine protein kinase [Thecamonas trahens ATCC 50062]KNC51454.1 serine/threonine protein kinase [Thecamonas trahens ATCC 50062]|eukprot:XP_013756116.1 serine/threonine protein kinase [Thecamonas trahens ATCC 50062]